MDLDQVGIAIACRCGAHMSADLAGVLFDDKGRLKISGASINCPRCGAIYHPGERLKYRLLFSSGGGYSRGNLKILNKGNGFNPRQNGRINSNPNLS